MFDKKLNTWLDEEVEIPSFKAVTDDKGNLQRLEQTTVKKTVQTMYSSIPETKLSCASGLHFYFMKDKHRGTAGCKHCTKHRFLRPVFEYIKDGHIYHRDTHELLD